MSLGAVGQAFGPLVGFGTWPVHELENFDIHEVTEDLH
jgi:hypothetical protein